MSDDLKRKKSDYLLELALEEQLENDREMQAYQSGNERPHEFSDEHNRKIKDILKRAEREENKKKYRRKRLQAAACIILILSVSTLTVTRVEAFRLPLIRFFSEIREKSTKLNMQGENNFNLTKKFQEYEPQYIPSGFSVNSFNESEVSFYIKYINDEENKAYTFYYFQNSPTKAMDTEKADVVETEINGNKAYIIEKEEEVRILMYKNMHQFYLRGSLPANEAYKIMESIK